MSSRTGRRVKPTGGYELKFWYFMRYSGLLLVFLAVGHLFIMHIVNNVETINYAFVASRWTAPKTGWVWRIWDGTMITLAVIHGFNGLRQVLYEYIVHPGRRLLLGTILWGMSAVLIILGGYSIAMFQEDKDYTAKHPLKNRTPVNEAPGPVAAVSPVSGR